jgi:hypothetical protein
MAGLVEPTLTKSTGRHDAPAGGSTGEVRSTIVDTRYPQAKARHATMADKIATVLYPQVAWWGARAGSSSSSGSSPAIVAVIE